MAVEESCLSGNQRQAAALAANRLVYFHLYIMMSVLW